MTNLPLSVASWSYFGDEDFLYTGVDIIFVYFQVNNGVLYFLEYEDNLHHVPLCSRFNVVANSYL